MKKSLSAGRGVSARGQSQFVLSGVGGALLDLNSAARCASHEAAEKVGGDLERRCRRFLEGR